MHRTRDVLGQWSLVIESRSVDVPHEFERARPEMLKCPLVHLRPICSELLLRGYDGVRQQLEDVLARHADMRLPASPCRHDGWRFDARRSKVLSQSLENGCAQKAIIGDGAVLNFCVDFRINPGRLRLLDRD